MGVDTRTVSRTVDLMDFQCGSLLIVDLYGGTASRRPSRHCNGGKIGDRRECAAVNLYGDKGHFAGSGMTAMEMIPIFWVCDRCCFVPVICRDGQSRSASRLCGHHGQRPEGEGQGAEGVQHGFTRGFGTVSMGCDPRVWSTQCGLQWVNGEGQWFGDHVSSLWICIYKR